MCTLILAIASAGLVIQNTFLARNIRQLREDAEAREAKIKNLTRQLNMFGGSAE